MLGHLGHKYAVFKALAKWVNGSSRHTNTHTNTHARTDTPSSFTYKKHSMLWELEPNPAFPKVTSRQVINIYIYFCTYIHHDTVLLYMSSLLSLACWTVFGLGTKKFAQNFTLNKFNNKNLPVNAKKCAHVLVMGGPHKHNRNHWDTLTHMRTHKIFHNS